MVVLTKSGHTILEICLWSKNEGSKREIMVRLMKVTGPKGASSASILLVEASSRLKSDVIVIAPSPAVIGVKEKVAVFRLRLWYSQQTIMNSVRHDRSIHLFVS